MVNVNYELIKLLVKPFSWYLTNWFMRKMYICVEKTKLNITIFKADLF